MNIEKKSYEAMIERLEAFVRTVDALLRRNGERRLAEWYDNQDVCTILCIGKRTLQSLRSSGALPFTRQEGKIWYKPSDVQRLIGKAHNTKKHYQHGK